MFEKKVNDRTICMTDIKEWANELEKNPDEILDQVQEWDDKQWTLFAYFEFDPYYIEDITQLDIDTDEVQLGPQWFYVLDDDEADEKADEYLDSYIDDCILPQIPKNLWVSFDSEGFKEDVLNNDGRGQQLASYDGQENEIDVDGTTYYIYRTN